jgi:DNA-binding NarL/FixJ family response regulator
VLTTFYDDYYISAAISNGADGYLLKDSEEDNLIRAIHQILSGQSILDSKVMKILSQRIVSTKPMDTKTIGKDKNIPKDLTGREMEVCVLIAEGYTNTNIAEKLYISEGTVKNYMSSIYDKFDLRDRTQLAILLKNILKK